MAQFGRGDEAGVAEPARRHEHPVARRADRPDDAAVLELVDLEDADLAAHRLDVSGDCPQLVIDLGVHRLEEALQRVGSDLGESDDVVKGDVVALLFEEID